jgi:hypothetical protein
MSTATKKGFFRTALLKLFKNWHIKSFSQKKNLTFFILVKKSPTKVHGYQLFGFSRFLYHTLFDYSASFNRKRKCLGALERYFIEENSKKPVFVSGFFRIFLNKIPFHCTQTLASTI